MVPLDSTPTPIQVWVMATNSEALSPRESILYQDFNQQKPYCLRRHTALLNPLTTETRGQNGASELLYKASRVVDKGTVKKKLIT